MDKRTQVSLTDALDAAIVATAKKEFRHLVQGKEEVEVAEKIHGALTSLASLQSGDMPKYDEWDALFYMLWYQPERINLAYTLVRLIMKEYRDSFIQGQSQLKVTDFGCGELATQFGLALAAAEDLREANPNFNLSISSIDSSPDMLILGRKLWNQFVREITIGDYPNLSDVRRSCSALRFSKASGQCAAVPKVEYSTFFGSRSDLESARWLTALHVAYEEITNAVLDSLDEMVAQMAPALILVTTHPISQQHAYSPPPEYSEWEGAIEQGQLNFHGKLGRVTDFRKEIYYEYIESISDGLSVEERERSRMLLTILPTSWITRPSFKSTVAIYTRE